MRIDFYDIEHKEFIDSWENPVYVPVVGDVVAFPITGGKEVVYKHYTVTKKIVYPEIITSLCKITSSEDL